MLSKLCAGFGLCALWISFLASPSFAQDSAAGKKLSTVPAEIYVDGAAIYEKPDFDSRVLDYLRYQTKVQVSKKAFRGTGGMGLFHRVRYSGSKLGWVPDTDVRVSDAESVQVAAPEKKSGSKAWEKEEEEVLGKAPLYFTRYLGGAVAMVNFTEKYQGRKLSDDMLMYGLRMTGPGTLFDGPPLDFNLWFSLDKPNYFSKFSSGRSTGFLLFGDVLAMFPLIDETNWLVTYGLGVMWVYTRYKIPVKSATFDSQELRIGGTADFGVARRIGKFLLRGDVKYYYEKTQYFGYLLSFQGEY